MVANAVLADASLRIAQFFQTNQSAINRNLVTVASGNRVNSPSDDPVDFFRISRMNTTLKGISRVQQGITAANALVQVAQSAGQSVFNNLAEMKSLLNEYYDPATTDEVKSVDLSKFKALSGEISGMIGSATYDGKKLIADSSTNPLAKMQIDPDDPRQTFQISYGAQDVVDVSGLALGQSDKATESAALDAQFTRAESYLAKTTAYSEAVTSFYDMSKTQGQTLQQTITNEQGCDTGEAMAQLTKREVCRQGALAMLAQANMAQQNMLQLITKI